MNKRNKQTIVLLLLVALLGAGAIYLVKSRPATTKVFSNFSVTDTAAIVSLKLTDRENREVILDRISSSEWRLNKQHDANQVVIESLLRTLYNIEVKAMVPRSGHNTVVSSMAAKNTLIQIYQRVPLVKIGRLKMFNRIKKTKSYFIGGPTPDHLGTYMMLENDKQAFITYVPGQNAFLSLRYSTKESDWRDHTILALTINQIQSVDVEVPGRPEESYRIVRVGDRAYDVFQFRDQRVTIPLDTLRILDFMASFRSLKYEGLINDMDPERKDSIVTSMPIQTITVNSVEGERYTIETFRRKSPYKFDEVTQKEVMWDRDRFYALINKKDLTLCQFYAFDNILKPFSYFKADAEPDEQTYFYTE